MRSGVFHTGQNSGSHFNRSLKGEQIFAHSPTRIYWMQAAACRIQVAGVLPGECHKVCERCAPGDLLLLYRRVGALANSTSSGNSGSTGSHVVPVEIKMM